MKKKSPLILSSILFSGVLLNPFFSVAANDLPADQALEAADDESELSRLLSVLDKHTEIATKSKLNTDFLPGMITVFTGDNLAARGVRTVAEALGLVPGIEVMTGTYGDQTIRGRAKQGAPGHPGQRESLPYHRYYR